MQTLAFDRIDVDPAVLSGQPVVRGTRLPVYVIVEALAAGDGIPDVLRAFPFLSEEDVKQALGFAAHLSRDGLLAA